MALFRVPSSILPFGWCFQVCPTGTAISVASFSTVAGFPNPMTRTTLGVAGGMSKPPPQSQIDVTEVRARKRPLPSPAVEPEGSGAVELLKSSSIDAALGPHGDRRSTTVTDGPPPGVEGTEAATSVNAADTIVERSESSVGCHEVQGNHYESALTPCQRPFHSRCRSLLHPLTLLSAPRLADHALAAAQAMPSGVTQSAACTAHPVDAGPSSRSTPRTCTACFLMREHSLMGEQHLFQQRRSAIRSSRRSARRRSRSPRPPLCH